MEAALIRDRAELWRLSQEHPDWTKLQFAEWLNRSISWVKKWLRRFKETPPERYPEVFFSRSRAPKNPRRKVTDAIRQRSLDIRDNPPENLRRKFSNIEAIARAITVFLRAVQVRVIMGRGHTF